MIWHQIIFISILVAISGCQPSTKSRALSQGPDPEQIIFREIISVNIGIVERIPLIPRDLTTPIP